MIKEAKPINQTIRDIHSYRFCSNIFHSTTRIGHSCNLECGIRIGRMIVNKFRGKPHWQIHYIYTYIQNLIGSFRPRLDFRSDTETRAEIHNYYLQTSLPVYSPNGTRWPSGRMNVCHQAAQVQCQVSYRTVWKAWSSSPQNYGDPTIGNKADKRLNNVVVCPMRDQTREELRFNLSENHSLRVHGSDDLMHSRR